MRFLRLLASPLACLWAVVLVAPAGAEPAFRAGSVAWPVPAGATAVAAGDVDGDGNADLAIACADADSIAVLVLARGGRLAAQSQYAVGTTPRYLLLVDLNHDGALDVAVANQGSGSISLLLGDGHGGFSDRHDVNTASRPSWLVAADFNRDGHVDLAVTCEGDDTLSILFGAGDGSFTRRSILFSGEAPSQVVAGDLDRDGNLDLAVLHAAQVSFFFGSQFGIFLHRSDLEATAGSIALEDLDGDANLDLVAVGGATDVYPGAGDGTFHPRVRYAVGTSGLSHVAAGKIDGDSWPDLLIADRIPDRLKILWGGPGGRFTTSSDLSGGWSPRTPVIADFTGDGLSDIAVASGSGLVSIFAATSERHFGESLELEDPYAVGAHAIATTDLDQDALPDLVTLDAYGFLVTHTAKGDGTFRPPTMTSISSTQPPLLLRDFDADGHPDLVVALPGRAGEPKLIVLKRGEPGGGFGPPRPIATLDATAFAAGDLNHDGRLDLFILGSEWNTIALGQGDGRFDTQSGPEAAGAAVVLCDLDADGNTDAVVGGRFDGALSGFMALRGHGDGTFDVAARGPAATTPSGVAAGDLDHDGTLDVVTSDLDGHRIAVNRGLGGFRFDAPQFYSTARSPAAVAVADFDTDGWLDVAAACAGSDVVTVLAGDGQGFPVRRDFGTRSHPNAMAVADWNGDALPDLATTNADDGAVTVLLNAALRTPVAIEDLGAERSLDCVRIRWRCSAAADAQFVSLRLQRSESEAGPFATILDWRAGDSSPREYCDADAPPDPVFYRLIAAGENGRSEIAGPVRSAGGHAEPVRLTLHHAQPGPGTAWRFPFAIAGHALDVTPAVLDVRGRVLWSDRARRFAPGPHVIAWDPAANAPRSRFPHGVYFLRLSHPGGTASTRFVVLPP